MYLIFESNSNRSDQKSLKSHFFSPHLLIYGKYQRLDFSSHFFKINQKRTSNKLPWQLFSRSQILNFLHSKVLTPPPHKHHERHINPKVWLHVRHFRDFSPFISCLFVVLKTNTPTPKKSSVTFLLKGYIF